MRRPRTISLLAALAALAACAALPAGAGATGVHDVSSAWQVNPGHTGFASGGSLERPPLRSRWTRTLGSSTSYPLIAEGLVFAIAYDDSHAGGTLYALDDASGVTVWSRSVPGGGYLAYDDGRVYISEDSGSVIAVAAATGETRWVRDLPEPYSLDMPVASDGTVYISSAWSGGAVYALDGRDGSTRWTSSFYYGGSPSLDGTYIYTSDDYQGATVAASRADGSLAWSGTKECFVGSGRSVADGARVVAPYNSNCGAVVDAVSGRQLDSIASNTAPASAGDVAVVLSGSTLQARSLSSGLLLWQYSGDGHLLTAPLIVNETVYAGSSTGALFAVDLRTGAQLWSGTAGRGFTWGTMLAAGGGMLVAPAGGTVTAFESASAPRPGLDLQILSGPDGPTSSSSATLTFGSDSPLASEVCRLDRGAWAPCLHAQSFAGLAEGPHMFEVQTRDVVRGEAIALAVRGWSVDTVAPRATISGGPTGVTNSRTAYGYVYAADDIYAKIECRLDGAAWAPCADAYYQLADGPHRIDARARDRLGNLQAVPATQSWVVDTRAPRSRIDSGPQGATADTDATFTFSADEPSTFRCAMDSAPSAPCTSPFAMSGVALGTHSFTVYATDGAGNYESYPGGATRTWTVGDPPADTTPPETTLTTGPPAVTAATSARFTFTMNEYGPFQCRLDAGEWSACGSPHDETSLSDGVHVLDVRGADYAGNLDESPARWSWTVDTRPPLASARIAAGSGPASGYRFTFTADEPGTTFDCALDAQPAVPCISGVTYTGLRAGEHAFAVHATDVAGNRDPHGDIVAFTVTTPPPSVQPPAPPPAPPVPPQAAPVPAVPSQPSTTQAARAASQSATQAAGPWARMLANEVARTLRTSTRSALRGKPKVRLSAAGRAGVAIVVTMRSAGHSVEVPHPASFGTSYLVVARSAASFTSAGTRKVRLVLSTAGRRALSRSARLKLSVRATVTPARGAAGRATVTARV